MSSTSTLSAVELALNKLPNVQVSSHPVLHHKLTLLRRNETKAATFRALLAELTFYLGYEATASFTVDQRMVTTPIGECSGFRLHDRLTIIPVMRAGMGMLDSMLKLIPRAAVHHLGLYHKRDHELPVLYYNKLPMHADCDTAVVLEPVIATAVTMEAVLEIVQDWGVKNIIVLAVLASEEGLNKLAKAYPNVSFFVAGVDNKLTADGKLSPGLGDAGDRIFGTGELEAIVPADVGGGGQSNGAKRKRTR